jgi:hypothetical protein
MKKNWLLVGGMFVIAGIAAIVADSLIHNDPQNQQLAALCVPGNACGGWIVTPPVPCIGTGFVYAKIRMAGTQAILPYVWGATKYLYGPPKNVNQKFVGKTTRICQCKTAALSAFNAPCSDVIYGTSAV